MRFWVGVTDDDWFAFLVRRMPDEVNFWQPGGNRMFRAIDQGQLFLFKLHSPRNFIVGGGIFLQHSNLPVSIAWEAFGEKNGAPNFQAFSALIKKHRERRGSVEHDPVIGCSIHLAAPFFWEQTHWIEVPHDWSPSIQRGKVYDSESGLGSVLWREVQSRLVQDAPMGVQVSGGASLAAELVDRCSSVPHLAWARLGQGAFRVLVTEAYHRRCAITGERTLPVLEAAHIKPFSLSGPNLVSNGLFMRSDLHKLFDQGYVTVSTSFHVEVSRWIKEEYENGRDYYALDGRRLMVIPSNVADRPSQNFLEWHNNNVFLG